MARTGRPYAAEFREQFMNLVRSGRTPEDLSREFEPTAQTTHNGVKQADLDAGRRSDGLTTEEREELRLLRRENKRLRMEQEILKKPQPGLLGRATRSRIGVRVREDESGCFFGSGDVPPIGSLSPSGYYAWLERKPSERSRRDAALTTEIERVWKENRRVYGRPRDLCRAQGGGHRRVEPQRRPGRVIHHRDQGTPALSRPASLVAPELLPHQLRLPLPPRPRAPSAPRSSCTTADRP